MGGISSGGTSHVRLIVFLHVNMIPSAEDNKKESSSCLSLCSLEKVTTYFVVLTFVNFLNFVDRGIIPGSTNEFNAFIQVNKMEICIHYTSLIYICHILFSSTWTLG